MTASAFLPAAPAGAARWRWARALALVVALHLAAAATFAALQRRSAVEDAAGGDAVLEVDLTAMPAETIESAVQSPLDGAEAPQTADVDERLSKAADDLPTEQSSPRPPEALDLRMAQQQTLHTTQTPDLFQTSEASPAQPDPMARAASAAASESLSDAGDAATQAASTIGAAGESARPFALWQARLFRHIARFRTYPQAARTAHATGDSLLAFTLARNGTVSSVRVVASSGHRLLDEAAVEVLRRASPMPPLPPEVPGQSLSLTIPMRFRLR
jgi:protein TonB